MRLLESAEDLKEQIPVDISRAIFKTKESLLAHLLAFTLQEPTECPHFSRLISYKTAFPLFKGQPHPRQVKR